MNYIKKMCILRQVKQGFSGDGKSLSGLIKIEQYGKNLAIEVSIINFAPLVSGEYYCLLSDNKGKTEMLSLRGKSLFNILSDLDVSCGFCGIICYVKNEIVPIAYGINGNGSYDWRKILNRTLPPVFPSPIEENAFANIPTQTINEGTVCESKQKEENNEPTVCETKKAQPYNDETVAGCNYYEEEKNEQEFLSKDSENARIENANQAEGTNSGLHPSKNGDAECVLHPFETNSDGYYLAVKGEIEALFSSYPKDDTLNGAFSCSKWVRIKGTKEDPTYLVGVIYENGKTTYICYALKAEDSENPPEEIKDVCTFIPQKEYDSKKGFFVLFQSAATGECIKPKSC